ncbi:VWA domain-containing protein [soil metagenome]
MTTTCDTTPDPTPPVHLYVLLDRSGSMSSIHAETVAGFNAFLAGQQIDGADARLTLVQFDDQDLADTIIDDLPIRRVRALRGRDFRPRGATPLLDATAALVARAKVRADERIAAGTPEKVVVVTITDGLENASVELTRPALRDLVAQREADGWVFVFLSAGLDAYDEARSFGYADGSVQSWAPDGEGAQMAFASLDLAVGEMRANVRASAPVAAHDVFGGRKPAEANRRQKRGDAR